MSKQAIATYRYGKDTNCNNAFRPKSRHYKDVEKRVRNYIFDNMNEWYITKEDIACKINVKVEEVEQILHKLNLEGLVTQPSHVGGPHDTSREKPWGDGSVSGWQADRYYPKAKDYMINYLKSGKRDEFREEMIERALRSSLAIIAYVLKECKGDSLSEHERRLLLLKLRDDGNYNYRFFEEYKDSDRSVVISYVTKVPSSCLSLLMSKCNIITPSERKKLFMAIFEDEFHVHTLIKNDMLTKKEKELVVQRAIDQSNFYLLDMIEKCTFVRIDKKLQDKVDAFMTMQLLISNPDRFNPYEDRDR